jgi:hypothetical protein
MGTCKIAGNKLGGLGMHLGKVDAVKLATNETTSVNPGVVEVQIPKIHVDKFFTRLKLQNRHPLGKVIV